MHSIYFYETDKPYGCFSNFARFPILTDGEVWPTSEHYFQAAKFASGIDRQDVQQASTPFKAAQIGRERSRSFRPDWDQVRDQYMKSALIAKFDQHPTLKQILISTGDAILIEHTSNDSYWADGGDGSGRNRLGELLMELRNAIQLVPLPFFAPPWVKFPDIEVSDMHWRMGGGEGYLSDCSNWYASLPEAARNEYNAYFPTPTEWSRSWCAT